ncbi:hypothetical protein N8I77_013524 [Diaporthe amygdali]|uniref:Heterokaryon incompatibility domain-containing protein n=1 Tax=Phomopsis amygdali TaxID=1214568 RepID=A0AAD9S0W8_PHOAM|nr:hypothetical protein N8I77_013524 [Diaporthe amygdali]
MYRIVGPYHRTVLEVSAVDHRPGQDVFWIRSGTGDQRDLGASNILQKLKQEEAPTVCGSPARLELAQHWLKECLTWHWECLYWRESFSMPSRVIDVGPKDGSREPSLYMPPPSHQDYYLCLSHRWGGAKVLQTVMGDPPGTPNGKTGTFSEFQSAIPMASMPKTFRDAVQVTRALGFRYIWIDSLCIVQDRPSDWEAEAKKMGSYYRNAHLTLFAGSAVSADSGLFFPIARPARPSHIGSVSVELPNCRHHGAEPHTFPLFAREPRMMRNQYGDGPKPKCALDERAWVLQEELLSARALIFTDEGLYWECTSLSASEWHPHGSQYLYTRALSAMDPDSYGGEVFRTPQRSCAQQFKAGLVMDREYLDSTPDPLVRALRSRVPVALGELVSELAALKHARVRMPPPSSTSKSKEMQMVRHHTTQLAKPEQDLQSGEEHHKHTDSTSRPSSPHPAQASAFRKDNIVALPFFWHRLVANYSARHLTRESDRLIAIQGLVSMLSAVRNDRYYAGLWGRTLQEDMLWVAADTKIDVDQMCDCMPQKIQQTQGLKPRRRSGNSETRQVIAPSWSWISADQGVMFLMLMDHFEVHEEFFRPLRIVMDDDTAVFNVRGRLTLEGVLRPVGLAVAFDEFHSWREIEGSIYNPSDPSKKKIGFWQPDRRTRMTGAMVCVPLVLMGRMKLVINCLVLEPTENCRLRNKASKLLEFRRIGMATIRAEHRAFLGLGKSQKIGDSRSWDDRVKEWTRKPVVIDIV